MPDVAVVVVTIDSRADVELPAAGLVAKPLAALRSDDGAALAGPRLLDGEGGDAVNGAFSFPSVRWIVLKRVGLAGITGRTAGPTPPAAPRTEPFPVSFVNGCCMLARRAALDAIGGLDETYRLYWEEIDLAHRLGDVGWRVLLVPGAEAVHCSKGSPCRPRFARERVSLRGTPLHPQARRACRARGGRGVTGRRAGPTAPRGRRRLTVPCCAARASFTPAGAR